MTESILSRISVVQADIASLAVDAIVNAANPSLLDGSGVAGAIHKAAGPGLEEECRRLGGRPTGEARMTKGHNLLAPFVIHAVGPDCRQGDASQAGLLRSCYKSSLRLAADAGLTSIAFPPISTGIFGYPKDEATDIAISAVCDWLRWADLPRSVVFCCHGAKTAELYRRKLEALA